MSGEEVLALKEEIKRLITRHAQIEQCQWEVEGKLYRLESDYHRQTATFGSLLSGLDGYLGVQQNSNANGVSRRASNLRKTSQIERPFSATSTHHRRALAILHRQQPRRSHSKHNNKRKDEDYYDGDDELIEAEDDDLEEEEMGADAGEEDDDEEYGARRRKSGNGQRPKATRKANKNK